MKVSQNLGCLLGVPIVEIIYSIFRSMLGSLSFEKLPYMYQGFGFKL